MKKEIFNDYSFKDEIELMNLVNNMEQFANINDNIQTRENNQNNIYKWND